jgi:capsular polysaccharide export protein
VKPLVEIASRSSVFWGGGAISEDGGSALHCPPITVCVGISRWKRRRAADFLTAESGRRPVFCRSADKALRLAAASGGAIGVWATRMPDGLAESAAAKGVELIRIEDGFIRSVGLGADFLPPVSLVFDRTGIYCDPGRPSDLETLLRDSEFDAALLARTRRLIERIVTLGITKYNLASDVPRIAWPTGRRRILVPGQVEDDLSVRLGGGGVRGNFDLLARVRAANPDAFIVYKPHPDVVAGHRKGALRQVETRRYADAVLRGGSMAALFGEIDELHTLTSLAGFEALLRRVPVTVYGQPFYAGWGLTSDVAMPPRGRVLALEEFGGRRADPVPALSRSDDAPAVRPR